MRGCPCSTGPLLLSVMLPSCALLQITIHACKYSKPLNILCPSWGLELGNCLRLPQQVVWPSCCLLTQHQTKRQALFCRSPGPHSHCWKRHCQTALAAQVNKVMNWTWSPAFLGAFIMGWTCTYTGETCNSYTVLFGILLENRLLEYWERDEV